MPGGQGTFPGLSVADNLQLAGWTRRDDKAGIAAATERVFEIFPVLRERLDEPAGNLSGGQQQMLSLGMSFVMKPRLLMIDELSLGLAPAVVDQLLGIIADIRAQGTTIILVEQSVNLALEMAETAYFMEKGEIRFHGPTAGAARAARHLAFGVPRRRRERHQGRGCGGARADAALHEVAGEAIPTVTLPATAARVRWAGTVRRPRSCCARKASPSVTAVWSHSTT